MKKIIHYVYAGAGAITACGRKFNSNHSKIDYTFHRPNVTCKLCRQVLSANKKRFDKSERTKYKIRAK